MNQHLPAPPPPDESPAAPLARISDRLAAAIDLATAPDQRAADGRAIRSDGWTAERKGVFLRALADCGIVAIAARAAGMSARSAYGLRNRAGGRDFALAWTAALQLARRRLADELMSRAFHGCVEVIVRDGEVWGERHRFDNRHSMAMLTRLDQQLLAGDPDAVNARLVAGDFDVFVDIVCAGGEGAADFLFERAKAEAEATEDGKPHCIEVRFVAPKP